jgi:3-dehydroquinate dehydratase/shikimate dehydrogenase
MAKKRDLPRICIALGLPDLTKLLEHARREAEAGETFLEFRLDYLENPERGAEAIAGFLREFPECTIQRQHGLSVSHPGIGNPVRCACRRCGD